MRYFKLDHGDNLHIIRTDDSMDKYERLTSGYFMRTGSLSDGDRDSLHKDWEETTEEDAFLELI